MRTRMTLATAAIDQNALGVMDAPPALRAVERRRRRSAVLARSGRRAVYPAPTTVVWAPLSGRAHQSERPEFPPRRPPGGSFRRFDRRARNSPHDSDTASR